MIPTINSSTFYGHNSRSRSILFKQCRSWILNFWYTTCLWHSFHNIIHWIVYTHCYISNKIAFNPELSESEWSRSHIGSVWPEFSGNKLCIKWTLPILCQAQITFYRNWIHYSIMSPTSSPKLTTSTLTFSFFSRFANLTSSFSSDSTGLPTKATIRILWFLPCLCFRANWTKQLQIK